MQQRSDFHYELPEELIAQVPPAERAGGRLLGLVGPGDALENLTLRDLPGLVEPGDVLVFNDSRVLPARLYGVKASGGRVEVMVERLHDEHRARAFVRASKSPRDGAVLELAGGARAEVVARDGGLFELSFDRPVLPLLEAHGEMPLPPYIQRRVDDADSERYQTVYARRPGSAAAPTAGLHFDEALLQSIRERGATTEFVTLHVGAGTFEPMRVESLAEHRMHSEFAQLDDAACERILAARRAGGRVIAVGTTSMRTLESAALSGELRPFAAETDLFIYPGFRFNVVDALVTNFHLPESTLLMLVCAFAGTERTLAAYRHAVAQRYRFFSYGDAMFVTPPSEGPHA